VDEADIRARLHKCDVRLYRSQSSAQAAALIRHERSASLQPADQIAEVVVAD
jgi:hypothetical protein